MIYYIENTINEWQRAISGYFLSYEDAFAALAECCNWYEEKGTGRILCVEPGLHKEPKVVYQK